jgi:alkanesulfonate monooxygenase SsuD/methylene tetrahydromethanopterin reductase-like flavin-dependent oxidoreductase (luciferase family)
VIGHDLDTVARGGARLTYAHAVAEPDEEVEMRVGVVLPIAEEDWTDGVPPYALVRQLAVDAEAAGLDSVWVFDHLLFRFDGDTTGIHECWTVLAAIAEATERITLGTLVMCTGFRSAALLAKMAATLDHVSDGRLILGIGAGWHDPEYDAFGYPTDRKVSRFEEAAEVITSLLRTGRADLDGTYTTARDCVLVPPARPDLPILIASEMPRMLGLTARYADAWNAAWYGRPNEQLATLRSAFADACATAGRAPGEVSTTVGITVRYGDVRGEGEELRGTPAEIADGLAAHAAVGVDHAIASLEPATPETLAEFAESVRLFRAG